MSVRIRRMVPEDYDAAYALWKQTVGMRLTALNNTYGGIAKLIAQNPRTCLVATTDGPVSGDEARSSDGSRIVGTALGAVDGRKGYLYHVAVDERWRGRGLGSSLISRVCDVFKAVGIITISLLTTADNVSGQQFWESQGWRRRPDVVYFTRDLE